MLTAPFPDGNLTSSVLRGRSRETTRGVGRTHLQPGDDGPLLQLLGVLHQRGVRERHLHSGSLPLFGEQPARERRHFRPAALGEQGRLPSPDGSGDGGHLSAVEPRQHHFDEQHSEGVHLGSLGRGQAHEELARAQDELLGLGSGVEGVTGRVFDEEGQVAVERAEELVREEDAAVAGEEESRGARAGDAAELRAVGLDELRYLWRKRVGRVRARADVCVWNGWGVEKKARSMEISR